MTGTLLAFGASTGWLLMHAGTELVKTCGPSPTKALGDPASRISGNGRAYQRSVPGHPRDRANTSTPNGSKPTRRPSAARAPRPSSQASTVHSGDDLVGGRERKGRAVADTTPGMTTRPGRPSQ